VGFLAIQELHGCHFIVALLDTVLSSLYGLSYLASRFPATPPPPCPCSVLPQSAPRGGFSPLHYRQAHNRIGDYALFPSRPYFLIAYWVEALISEDSSQRIRASTFQCTPPHAHKLLNRLAVGHWCLCRECLRLAVLSLPCNLTTLDFGI